METETLDPLVAPVSLTAPTPPLPPTSPPRQPSGFAPTPDPTRSGAMWVGGAGVALLLAAAAVLTAVRWDEIGQSVKLGGLVAITLALLGAGQRFKETIPMTAQAIFHLGALLIPFDMAAVAILAGRSWQEALLLTSVTSVVGWYAINAAVPSAVLKWSARGAVIALAAGVAAVSPISMPLALAVAAVVAIGASKATAAGVWAFVAAALPVASFVPWPTRIAGAMNDLGFNGDDRWQPLAAGTLATIVLVLVAQLRPRLEVAWASVVAAVVTTIVGLGGFGDAQVSFISMGALFVGLELAALVSDRDPLWKQITSAVASVAEALALLLTTVLVAVAVIPAEFNFEPTATTLGIAGVLVALGWLTADRRRLEPGEDWIAALLIGSDWPLTTVMFPLAVLAATFGYGAPAAVLSLIAIALGYWMVATWRTGSTIGAVALVTVAALSASTVGGWVELGLAGLAAALLMLTANTRIRPKDLVESMVAAIAGVLVWLVGVQSVVTSYQNYWPLLIVVAGAWALSWIAEMGANARDWHPIDWIGRLTAAVIVFSSLWIEPVVAISLCAGVGALAAIDYARRFRLGISTTDQRLRAYSLVGAGALGGIGVPIAALVGLTTAPAGAVLTIAGFIVAGVALVSPKPLELPLGAASVLASSIGLTMALGDDGMFAVALMATGCTTMFVGAALREAAFGIAGYGAAAVGVALGLAVLDVTWLEPYLVMPAIAALYLGWRYQRHGGSSWVAYTPTIALFSYVAIAERINGGPAWHAVIAGAVGVLAIIGGGYRKLAGPLVTGSVVLALVAGYESLGPAALVPTWAWLAAGGTILLAAGVAMERSDTTPLERGQHIRNVIAEQFS